MYVPCMAKKFDFQDDKPIERCYEVDGVYVTEAEFDKLSDRRAWWPEFWAGCFELVGTISLLLLGIWFFKG